jgi:hypothetical protein
VEAHPYWRNQALLDYCRRQGVHVTAYSPLGSPDSAAVFNKPVPQLMRDPVVVEVAEQLGRSPAQVLIRWATSGWCAPAAALWFLALGPAVAPRTGWEVRAGVHSPFACTQPVRRPRVPLPAGGACSAARA